MAYWLRQAEALTGDRDVEVKGRTTCVEWWAFTAATSRRSGRVRPQPPHTEQGDFLYRLLPSRQAVFPVFGVESPRTA